MSDTPVETPQAGAPTPGQEPTPTPTPDASGQTFPLSYVQELRTEAATNRTKAATLETKLTTANTAHEAALKAANDARDAALTLAKTASINAAVVTKASLLGFADPDDAVKLLDASKVTYEDGKVEGVDDALKALATSKPHLLGSRATGDGPDKKKPGAATDMNAIIRRDAKVVAT